MIRLNNDEMESIKGGAIKSTVIGGIIAGALSFIAGLVHGYLNPRKCN